jgi:acetyl-CoA acyltransferase
MAFASAGQLEADETIRPGSTVEALAGLRPAFADAERTDRFGEIDGKVTAGISSLVNDRSATLPVTTSETATARGWRPRPREHTMSVVGDDPVYLPTATARAKVLARAGLSIDVMRSR